MQKVTSFKTQFPVEDVIEVSKDENKFIDFDLNIGWTMNAVNS
jgi:hypothetical protein